MNPDSVTLENLTKNFEYVKLMNRIYDIVVVKDLAKCHYKLYLK